MYKRQAHRPATARPALALLVVVLIGGAFLLWAINRTAAEEPRPTPAVAQSTTTAPAAQPTSTLAAPVAAPTGNGTLMAVVAPVTVTTSATDAPAGPPRARLTTATTLSLIHI